MSQAPVRDVVTRAEAGTQTITAKTTLVAAAGVAPEETMELVLAKLPMLLEVAGEPKPLNQLLELPGKRISCAPITSLLWQDLYFLNNLMVITRANGQYQG